jgi:hypothetical protein
MGSIVLASPSFYVAKAVEHNCQCKTYSEPQTNKCEQKDGVPSVLPKAGRKARNSIARSTRIDSGSARLGSFNFSNELSKHPSSCLNEPAREPAREPNEPKLLALNFY